MRCDAMRSVVWHGKFVCVTQLFIHHCLMFIIAKLRTRQFHSPFIKSSINRLNCYAKPIKIANIYPFKRN